MARIARALNEAQDRDGCAVRAGLYSAAEPAIAEELGQIYRRLPGGLLATVSQVVSAFDVTEPLVPAEASLAVSECREYLPVRGALHHSSMPPERLHICDPIPVKVA
jgi:hypothetical protein